jgi:hypothetical protein
MSSATLSGFFTWLKSQKVVELNADEKPAAAGRDDAGPLAIVRALSKVLKFERPDAKSADELDLFAELRD